MRNALFLSILVVVAGLATVGCGDTASSTCSPDNLNHPYLDSTSGIELVLGQNCSSGAVSGDLFDPDSFRYDLTGSIEEGRFTFTATRALPSGTGTDTYRTDAGGIEVLNNGITLRGVVYLNSISIAEQTIFSAREE